MLAALLLAADSASNASTANDTSVNETKAVAQVGSFSWQLGALAPKALLHRRENATNATHTTTNATATTNDTTTANETKTVAQVGSFSWQLGALAPKALRHKRGNATNATHVAAANATTAVNETKEVNETKAVAQVGSFSWQLGALAPKALMQKRLNETADDDEGEATAAATNSSIRGLEPFPVALAADPDEGNATATNASAALLKNTTEMGAFSWQLGPMAGSSMAAVYKRAEKARRAARLAAARRATELLLETRRGGASRALLPPRIGIEQQGGRGDPDPRRAGSAPARASERAPKATGGAAVAEAAAALLRALWRATRVVRWSDADREAVRAFRNSAALHAPPAVAAHLAPDGECAVEVRFAADAAFGTLGVLGAALLLAAGCARFDADRRLRAAAAAAAFAAVYVLLVGGWDAIPGGREQTATECALVAFAEQWFACVCALPLLLAQSVVVDRLGAVLAVVVWTAQLAAAVVGAEPEERADGALGAAFALTVLGVAAACCVAHGRPRDAVAATLAAWLLLMGAAYWGAPHDVAVALAAAAALTAATLPLMAGRGAEPPVIKEL